MEVHAVALKDWMLLDMDDHIKVTRSSVAKPSFAAARAAQPRALVDTCGNFELHSGGALHPSIAMALATRFFNDPTGSLTVWACLRDLKKSARGDHLTPPAANRTRDGMGALLRPRAFADIAHVELADFNLLFAAVAASSSVICMS